MIIIGPNTAINVANFKRVNIIIISVKSLFRNPPYLRPRPVHPAAFASSFLVLVRVYRQYFSIHSCVHFGGSEERGWIHCVNRDKRRCVGERFALVRLLNKHPILPSINNNYTFDFMYPC